MDFDGVDELEIDDEDLQPMQLMNTRRLPATAAPAPMKQAAPAAMGLRAPGQASAPVSLVPPGWPNGMQQRSAPASGVLQPQRQAVPAWQEPPSMAPALPRLAGPGRAVLMPSQGHRNQHGQQQHINPSLFGKRPAEQQHAAAPNKRVTPPGPARSSGGPVQAPAAQSLAAPHCQPPQCSTRMGSRPSTLCGAAGQQQPQAPCAAAAGAFLPGPAGVLQRQMQQAGPDGSAQDDGTPNPGRAQHLYRPAPEADLNFATPQWHAAQRKCSRLAGALRPAPGLGALMETDAKAGKVQWLAVCIMGLSLTGCGDAFAQLKDPTCTVGAGICQKVLDAHPRIRDCGTAAVLKNVTFLRMEHVPYLCITLANIVQVFPASD